MIWCFKSVPDGRFQGRKIRSFTRVEVVEVGLKEVGEEHCRTVVEGCLKMVVEVAGFQRIVAAAR